MTVAASLLQLDLGTGAISISARHDGDRGYA